jgi:hypothetical protein
MIPCIEKALPIATRPPGALWKGGFGRRPAITEAFRRREGPGQAISADRVGAREIWPTGAGPEIWAGGRGQLADRRPSGAQGGGGWTTRAASTCRVSSLASPVGAETDPAETLLSRAAGNVRAEEAVRFKARGTARKPE